jgi:hypothetical protein
MPVARFLQASFSSGEFDPLLDSREDVSFFYTSAKLIENAIPLPQGGMKRREGLRLAGKLRGALFLIGTSGWTLTADNGGVAANALSLSEGSTLLTTGGIGTATLYNIVDIDAGSDERLSMADIQARLVGGSLTSATLGLFASDDDVTYTQVASIEIGTAFSERRFSAAADTDLADARYFRLALVNPDGDDYGAGEVELFGFRPRVEAGYSQLTGVDGNVKLAKITATNQTEYFVALTVGNADIYTEEGVFVASVPIPHNDLQIQSIKTAQQQDTLVLYHPEHPPHVIQRLVDLDEEWRSGEFQFSSVAQFPFVDSTTGGQNEIQEINFTSWSAGDRYVIEYNGDISGVQTFSATAATNVSNLTTAIEGLADITDVTVTDEGSNNYSVEFVGVDGNTFFATLVVSVLEGSGTVVITRRQKGRPPQEDLFSATRGYPRCGTFYQGRHWMAGFKGRPDVIVGSRAGNFGDFKEDADPVATSPLVLAPNIDEQVTVENIYAGRNLQIFTSSAEIYVPSEPITPDTVALKVTSKRGASPLSQPVDVQGGTMFVDRNGTALREYLFLDTQASYTAEPISTLGGHLVQNPVELSLRRSVDTNEPTLIYVINQGRDRDFNKVPAASITIDRAQQVIAFSRIVSGNGEFKSVASTQGGATAFAVERDLSGNKWTFLEFVDERFLSDHAEQIENPDIDEFSATDGQTVFTYTFSNPLIDNDIAVFRRADSSDVWSRVPIGDYTLDTTAKTITLDTGLDAGVKLAICKRATSFTITSASLSLQECYVHGDGRPLGAHTPVGNAVTIKGDEGFFFSAQIGLRMVPKVILQAYKGQGGQSPTMKRQRIFRTLLNVERTGNIAVSMETGSPRVVPLVDYDGFSFDADLEDTLFTGTKRVSGVGSWKIEPRLQITQTEPAPWLLRSVSYDIRF